MGREQNGEASSSGMYTYKHHCDKRVDIHEILPPFGYLRPLTKITETKALHTRKEGVFVKKSRSRVLLSYVGAVFLLANVCRLLLVKESLSLWSVCSITFVILVAKCLQYKPVKKESVVIMPVFGVQLEIHFLEWKSGSLFRQILKPLLNECVTPVTCYWSLALLLRDEEELMLFFQIFRPPVKMLVPIWKALCSFTNAECPSPCAVSKPKYSKT